MIKSYLSGVELKLFYHVMFSMLFQNVSVPKVSKKVICELPFLFSFVSLHPTMPLLFYTEYCDFTSSPHHGEYYRHKIVDNSLKYLTHIFNQKWGYSFPKDKIMGQLSNLHQLKETFPPRLTNCSLKLQFNGYDELYFWDCKFNWCCCRPTIHKCNREHHALIHPMSGLDFIYPLIHFMSLAICHPLRWLYWLGTNLDFF